MALSDADGVGKLRLPLCGSNSTGDCGLRIHARHLRHVSYDLSRPLSFYLELKSCRNQEAHHDRRIESRPRADELEPDAG